jgi:hypothetical protein
MEASSAPADDERDAEFEEPLQPDTGGKNRRRAALAVFPFLLIGVGNAVLIVAMGTDPLWGFAILPPILFCSVLAYIVFSTDFLDDRT